MKKGFCIISCVLLIVSLAITAAAVTSVPDAVLKAKDSVVRVLAEYPDGYATGSGFVVKSDREETLIATNYHVVEENPYSISVWIGEEETVSASVASFNSQKDLCILRLAYPVAIPSVSLSSSDTKQGAAVYAVGFPSDADYLSDREAHTSADATITDGIVSALREVTVSGYGTPVKILQINAAINHGNSGGPLFNDKGEVVGINTYGIGEAQGIFGAIAVSELILFAQDNAISLSSGRGSMLWVLCAAAGFALCIGMVLLRKKGLWKLPDRKQKAVAIAVLLVLLAIYPGSYLGARVCTMAGNAAMGEKLLFLPALTRLHDPKFTAYMEGMELLEQRRNGEAKAVFSTLTGYLDAESLAVEADYRYALQRADANDFDTAIRIMKNLGERGYRDSGEKALEMQYRQGTYLLYEAGDYNNAIKLFKALIKKEYPGAREMEKEAQYIWALDLADQGYYTEAYHKLKDLQGYSDAEESLEALTEHIYRQGEDLYHNGAYIQAEVLFSCIAPYGESENFLTLIQGRDGKINTVEALRDIFHFEDAAEVLLSSHEIGKRFLLGTWRGTGQYFTMEHDGHISYSLPDIQYGDYYRIEDGVILLYPENDRDNTIKLFTLKAIAPDCIEFHCHGNGKTYTLIRS